MHVCDFARMRLPFPPKSGKCRSMNLTRHIGPRPAYRSAASAGGTRCSMHKHAEQTRINLDAMHRPPQNSHVFIRLITRPSTAAPNATWRRDARSMSSELCHAIPWVHPGHPPPHSNAGGVTTIIVLQIASWRIQTGTAKT